MAITTRNTSWKLEYIPENTRGTPVSSGSLHIPSDSVFNIGLHGTNNGEVVYSISDYDGIDTSYDISEFTLHFEYYLQRTEDSTTKYNALDDSLLYHACTRSSGALTPLTFYLHTNSTTTFVVKGAVIDTFTGNCRPREKIHCVVDCSAASVAVEAGNIASLTASQSWGNTFETFRGAGATRSGSFDAGVGDFSFTIANNLERLPLVGQSTGNVYEGLENCSGTIDVILDSGGNTDWEEMLLHTEASIVLDTGTSTTAGDKSMKLTFGNAHYTDFDIDANVDSRWLHCGVPWKAETVTLAEYS